MSASENPRLASSSHYELSMRGFQWLCRKLFWATQCLGFRKLGQVRKQGRVAGAIDRDTKIVGESGYPLAVDPSRVGRYPARVKSGGGCIYDEVLEYRVWLHPERGAKRWAEDADYFLAFAQYERAAGFAMNEPGAEAPLVLVRQFRHLNEPQPGVFELVEGERLTEWQVEWLGDE